MPRDIRGPIGVQHDKAILLIAVFQPPTTILGNGVQIGHDHVEVFLPNTDDLGIDLESIDGDGTKYSSYLPGGCASSQTDHGNTFQLF